MNRRQLETLLLILESTPILLARAAEGVPAAHFRRRPTGGGFSFVEHVWHLADLEREGYGVRVRRMLTEDEPSLANFDGDRAARERRYEDRDPVEGLTAFAFARRRNLEKLRSASRSDWKRSGVQEGAGRIVLADVPQMMAEHDRSHTQDIRQLLGELSGETLVGPGDRRTSAVA
jgi:hypothetical protein